MRSPRLALQTLKRLIGDAPLVRIALAAIVIVPLLYGALYLWAFWDPYGHLDRLPIALVNLDRPVVADGERLAAGRDLANNLVDSGSLGWHLTTAADAAAGVSNGRYYLSLTIPADFSAKLATANSGAPERARLYVIAHESTNMLASLIAEHAFSEVRAAASRSVARKYLDKVLVGFSEAHGGFADAAAGATDLASGVARARSGARTLATGSSSAAQGAQTLSSGVANLHAGVRTANAGARSLDSGSHTLARGLSAAHTGAATVAGCATSLARGSGEVASTLGTLCGGADSLAKAAAALARGAAELRAGMSDAFSRLEDTATGAVQVRNGANTLDASLHAYLANHPEAASDTDFRTALGASSQVKSGAAALSDGLATASDSAPALANGAQQVDAGAAALAAGSKQLSVGLAQAHEGATSVASGADSLESGTRTLSAGIGKAATGAIALADGSAQLSAGTRQLSAGAGDAESGANRLAVGLVRLRAGTHTLARGLTPAVAGARTLASSLASGATRIPDYAGPTRAANAAMMSDPVDLSTHRIGAVPNYGTGFAPYFIPLALWIGALVIFFLLPALPPRALAAGAPGPISAFAGLLPAGVIGVAQAVILLAVVQIGLGLSPIAPLETYALVALVALVSVAILQLLNAALGPAGKLLSIVLLMLQLTSAAGTFPLQLSPAFFQAIHPWLPMTYAVDGLRQTISGGDLHAALANAAALALFGVASLALTSLTANRRKTFTVERLHPVLDL